MTDHARGVFADDVHRRGMFLLAHPSVRWHWHQPAAQAPPRTSSVVVMIEDRDGPWLPVIDDVDTAFLEMDALEWLSVHELAHAQDNGGRLAPRPWAGCQLLSHSSLRILLAAADALLVGGDC